MTPTQQRNLRISDHDWKIVSDYAARANMTPQAWLVNVVVGGWMESAGHRWEGVKAVGNPNWVKQDNERCQCGTEAQFPENGITCGVCGKPMF